VFDFPATPGVYHVFVVTDADGERDEADGNGTSGACNPADVLAVIDLLNGAGAFDRWNNRPLPACPFD